MKAERTQKPIDGDDSPAAGGGKVIARISGCVPTDGAMAAERVPLAAVCVELALLIRVLRESDRRKMLYRWWSVRKNRTFAAVRMARAARREGWSEVKISRLLLDAHAQVAPRDYRFDETDVADVLAQARDAESEGLA